MKLAIEVTNLAIEVTKLAIEVTKLAIEVTYLAGWAEGYDPFFESIPISQFISRKNLSENLLI